MCAMSQQEMFNKSTSSQGGFPCQDISWAGKGRGIDYDLSEQEGTRSGLWWEMWRVIRDLRPRYVIAENVPALTHRGLDIVLGSLAEIGYDAEWQTVSAASVGAPHIRERIFIVAYPQSERPGRRSGVFQGKNGGSGERVREPFEPGEIFAYPNGERSETVSGAKPGEPGQHNRRGLAGIEQPGWFAGPIGQPWPVSFKVGNASGESGYGSRLYGLDTSEPPKSELGNTGGAAGKCMEVEYDFCGVAHGVSDRVGALKGYGNAVVPQVAYLVGRAVMAHHIRASG